MEKLVGKLGKNIESVEASGKIVWTNCVDKVSGEKSGKIWWKFFWKVG